MYIYVIPLTGCMGDIEGKNMKKMGLDKCEVMMLSDPEVWVLKQSK